MSNKKNIKPSDSSPPTSSMGDIDAKKSKLSADSEIYNKKRPDHIVKGQFKTMSFKEKVIHFKEYYRTITIFIIVGILLITSLIILDKNRNTEENTFYCGFLNGISLEYITQADMPEHFVDYLNSQDDYNGKPIAKHTFITTFKNDIFDTSRVDGCFDEGIFDALVLPSNTFNSYASINALMDLSEVFTEEELRQLDSRIIYVIDPKSGNKTPLGLLLDNTKYEFKIGNTILEDKEAPIYAIPTCASRYEEARHFIFFLLEE